MLLPLNDFKQKQIDEKQKQHEEYLNDGNNYRTCINGHLMTPDNIYTCRRGNKMETVCETCRKLHHSQYKRINGKLIKVKQLMDINNRKRALLKRKNYADNTCYYKRERESIIKLLGSICVKCNFSDPRALQIDHINGGGVRELKSLSYTQYYKKIRESLTNNRKEYQLLCANCNWIKRHENNENPGIR